jgi:hypothetical protein
MFGPDSSGQEAFDHVFARLRTGPFALTEYDNCQGVQLWRRFLKHNPNATLEQCLVEYEARMGRLQDRHWTHRLLEAFEGQVYPEFIERVLAVAPPVIADALMRDRPDLDCEGLRKRCEKHKPRENKHRVQHVKGPILVRPTKGAR